MNYSMDTIPLFGPYALRRLRAEDAADIFRSIDTQRPYLGRWLPFVAETHCVEQSEAVVAGMLADTANPVYTIRDGRAFAGRSAKRPSRRWACGVSRSAAARATCRATPFPGGSGSGSAMWNRGARSSPTESGST